MSKELYLQKVKEVANYKLERLLNKKAIDVNYVDCFISEHKYLAYIYHDSIINRIIWSLSYNSNIYELFAKDINYQVYKSHFLHIFSKAFTNIFPNLLQKEVDNLLDLTDLDEALKVNLSQEIVPEITYIFSFYRSFGMHSFGKRDALSKNRFYW